MAANIWNNALVDGDGNAGGNWSAAHVPEAGEIATFNNTSDANCTFTSGLTCDGIQSDADYDGDIDYGAGTWIIGSDGVVLDHPGDIDLGTILMITTNGDFDWENVGTVTPGTATIAMAGTANLIPKAGTTLYILTISAGATITYDSGGASFTVSNTVVINGELAVAAGKTVITLAANVSIGGTGVLSGAGAFRVQEPGASKGIIVFDGSITIAELALWYWVATSVLAPGTYGATTTKLFSFSVANTVALTAAGDYTFNNLILTAGEDADCTLANNTNGPASITILGDFTIDIDGAGDVIVSSSGKLVDWDFAGDVVDEDTGGGVFSWTKGTGTITASGGSDQDCDFMGETIEDIVVDKLAGTLTFSGGWTADSFDAQDGEVDFNGQTVVCSGDMLFAYPAGIDDAADAMNGADITVGGDFLASNVDFQATAGYTLAVTGASAAYNCVFEECDATGAVLWAYQSTDGGNNTNIRFQPLSYGRGQSMLGVAI